ncbi:hypothetical protein M885DRAFT_522424 [Pelagophyceae sp. CCMP2097]|nr:hypothetical protein M885DRAFT_522424 [Pelagophyceae sp. CCMP2097]
MELQQSFYGSNWRTFSQRYEIGLSASKVTDSGGRADGGRVEEGNGFGDEADTCDAEEGLEACVARHGAGEYVLLGKVPEQGASPHEGVAQLINDHTALRAPTLSDDGDGIISTRDVDQLIVASSKVPIKTNVRLLRKAVDDYIDRIATRTNVALVQPRTAAQGVSAPRVFAVATRPIARGEELRMTYGVEWWLSQLRTAALAQLVTCEPGPMRKAALAGVIRDFERVSLEAVAKQRAAVSLAGCMPGSYVQPLEAVPALDSLLDDGWRRAILYEEFATATECPLDHVYIDTSPPKAPWPPISESNRPDF